MWSAGCFVYIWLLWEPLLSDFLTGFLFPMTSNVWLCFSASPLVMAKCTRQPFCVERSLYFLKIKGSDTLLDPVFRVCWHPQERALCFRKCQYFPHIRIGWALCVESNMKVSLGREIMLLWMDWKLDWAKLWCSYHTARLTASLLHRCELWPNSVKVTEILRYLFCLKKKTFS